MFDGIGKAISAMIFLCLIFIPFGLWKLMEIIIWLWSNIHWGAKP